MKKFLVRVIVGLFVIVVIAVIAVTMFLDRIVKSGIETVGPQVAKVTVKLDKASVSLLSGKGELSGLVIGNPEGYKTETAIKADNIKVAVKPSTVFSQNIAVESVQISAPDITLEGGLNKNNLTQILANIDASLGGGGTKPGGDTSGGASQKKIVVSDLMITDGKIHVVAYGRTANVALPTIHLTNLGQGSNGITAADLSKIVIAAVLDGSTKAAGSVIADLGKGAVEAATKLSNEAASKLGKEAAGAVEKATKGIGDLFKKK